MTDVLVQTLRLICPEPPVEIRVLTDQKKKMQIERFAVYEEAAAWAGQFPAARGIYFVMNPFDLHSINGMGVDDQAVTRRRRLLIDADPIRPTNTNSTAEELASAHVVATCVKDYLTSVGWPEPVECDSGNGAHLLYAIDLPNDDETRAAVVAVLKHLSHTYSTPGVHIDTTVGNASRITKFYGTVTRKGPDTADRPHRLSAITHIPEPFQTVSPVHFEKIARLWTKSADPISDGPPATEVTKDARVELAQSWLAVQRPAIQGGHGDAHTFYICCAVAVGHDLSPDDTLEVLAQWNKRCRPPWEVSDLRNKIQNAIRNADEPRGGRLRQFPLTEAGDAECFASLYQDVVRFDHRQGRWLLSDESSGIWTPDPKEQLTLLTTRMMRTRQRQALTIEDSANRKAAQRWTMGGEFRKRLTNTTALARAVPPVADIGDNWDQEPFLLGVQNGVVDLLTGQWRKASAGDRVTMRVRVTYDPNATCPLWLAFLASIFASSSVFDADESQLVVDFLQRAIGYSITGDCREECCFFVWGTGCNGKGTLMNTVGWLLADYTDDLPYSTLEKSIHGNGIPNDLAKLVGKRFITCAEVNEFTLNEARLKALTGRDPMTARFLHREWFTFIPVGKIWIATNNKPKIVGTDDGIWRRIHLVPFLQTFEGRENKKLKDQLREELPGILNWCIAGTRKWLEEGLNPPKTVKMATAEYRDESNPIKPFVESCCVIGEGLRMQAGPAFKAYELYCKAAGEPSWKMLTDKAFHTAMRREFKFEERRQTFYLGVGLAAQGREPGEEG